MSRADGIKSLVRASSLNQARLCPAYPWQATQDSECLSAGTRKHKDIEAEIEQRHRLELGQDRTAPSESSDHVTKAIWYGGQFVWGADILSALPEVQMSSAKLGLSGTADVVFQHQSRGPIHVVDWKTGGNRRYPPVRDDLQMVAYAMLVQLFSQDSAPSVTVHRVHLDADDISPSEYTRWDFPALLPDNTYEPYKEVMRTVGRVLAGRDEFNKGPHCGECLAREACPAWDSEFEKAIKGDYRVTYASWAVARPVFKSKAAAMDDLLFDAVQAGKEVEADGKVLAIAGTTRDVVPDWGALERHCLEMWDCKPSSRTLKALNELPVDEPREELKAVALIEERPSRGRLVWRNKPSPALVIKKKEQ